MLLFDSTSPTTIPPTAQLIVGYINGHYQSYNPIRAKFPHAFVLTATTTPTEDADILDCEPGNITTLSLVAFWLSKFRKPNTQRTVYCSLDLWSAVQAAVADHELIQPYYWIADWTNIVHLVPGSVATQYASHAGYDESITDGVWPYSQLSLQSLQSLQSLESGSIVSLTIATGIIAIEGNSNGHKFLFTIPLKTRTNSNELSILDLSAEAAVKNVVKATSFIS